MSFPCDIPQTKICIKCRRRKDGREFLNPWVCMPCMDRKAAGPKSGGTGRKPRGNHGTLLGVVNERLASERKKNAALEREARKTAETLKARLETQTRLASEAHKALIAGRGGADECPYARTCPQGSCRPDQQEWCRKQEAFMLEPDAKKRNAMIWDFVMSFQHSMRILAKKRIADFKSLELDDLTCQATFVFVCRFCRMMDEGIYEKKTNVRAYLYVCLKGIALNLLKTNGAPERSLDGMTENGFHGLKNKWIA